MDAQRDKKHTDPHINGIAHPTPANPVDGREITVREKQEDVCSAKDNHSVMSLREDLTDRSERPAVIKAPLPNLGRSVSKNIDAEDC